MSYKKQPRRIVKGQNHLFSHFGYGYHKGDKQFISVTLPQGVSVTPLSKSQWRQAILDAFRGYAKFITPDILREVAGRYRVFDSTYNPDFPEKEADTYGGIVLTEYWYRNTGDRYYKLYTPGGLVADRNTNMSVSPYPIPNTRTGRYIVVYGLNEVESS